MEGAVAFTRWRHLEALRALPSVCLHLPCCGRRGRWRGIVRLLIVRVAGARTSKHPALVASSPCPCNRLTDTAGRACWTSLVVSNISSICTMQPSATQSSSRKATRWETPPSPSSAHADTSTRKPSAQTTKPPELKAHIAFGIFACANITAAIFSPIQDCDEVFNYWEPTHYLNHGYGLQTWEYSPEYAIRSWAYSGIHSLIIWLGLLPFRMLSIVQSKTIEFYFLRVVLALVCTLCQTRLYSVVSRTINERVAVYFLFSLVFSPGMYHAAPAYLPSSFAMYATMLGFSAFIDWRGGLKTAQGIMWLAIGSSLGWPFAGALVLPFVAEEVFLAGISGEAFACFRRLLDGAVRSLIVMVRLKHCWRE